MATDATPARETDQLKSQLNEQKELLKKKEKEWRDADGALRRGISRLTFAMGGIDAKLDRLLTQLRDAIRENLDTATLVENINDIADLVKQLDDRAAQSGTGTDAGTAIALQVLRELEFPDALRKRARKLAQRFESTPDDAALAGELTQLLRDALHGYGTPTHDGGGLLDRLVSVFARTPGPTPTTPPQQPEAATSRPPTDARQVLLSLMQRIHVPDEDNYTVKQLIARLESAADGPEFDAIVAEYSEVANAAQRTRAPAVDDPSAAPRIEEVFIQLVEELTVPAELQDEANRIKEQLARSDHGADFSRGFAAIVELVTAMRRMLVQEKLELQEFLQQLTVRLQELDRHLGGTQSQQKTWAEEGRKLEAAVHSQVQDIKVTVHDAADLNQLKASITERIDVLQRHLDEYQTNEVRRQERLATELAAVKSRLVNVETEADQLRTRLKDKHQQAIVDPLTGAYNRLAYDERVAAEVARWKRYGNPLALLVLDVDHFKKINDHYGHKAGDKALKLIAQVLKDNLRETDFLARYGGEEFVVLVTETSEDKLAGITEKLRKAIETCKFHYAGKDVPITLSCGYTMFHAADTAETAFNRADAALYQAKERGRNRVCAG